MAKGDNKEASKATGIPLKKLNSKKPLTAAEQVLYDDWLSQGGQPDSWAEVIERLNAPNPQWTKISEKVGVPYGVVAKIGELSTIISAASFSTSGPFASDIDSWPEARDPKRGSAPLFYLIQAIERLEDMLVKIYWPNEGRSVSAQAMDFFAPDDLDSEKLWQALAQYKNAANRAREFRIKLKKPPLPDWVREAARYMIDLGHTKEQFQDVVQAIEPKLQEKKNIASTTWDMEVADQGPPSGKDPVQVLKDFHESLARIK